MKLELLISPSGFGKTHYILEDIEKNRKHSKIIVLTPEQNSFNFEKLLCDKFGGTFNIDVMNFSTLTKNISKKISLDSLKNINDDIKPFYLYKAAQNLKERDNFLVKRILQDTKFIEVVEDILEELKQYRVTINTLEEYLEKNQKLEQAHREKLEAILEVYVEYTSLLKSTATFDKEDYINEFLLYMEYANLSDYIFYVDAYYNFSAQEYSYIEKIIQKSKKVVFSVIAEPNRYFNVDLVQLAAEYDIANVKYEPFYLEDLYKEEKYKLDIFRKSHEIVASLNEIIRRNKELKVEIIPFVKKDIIYTLRLILDNNNVVSYKIISEHESRFEQRSNLVLGSEYYKAFKSQDKSDNSVEIIRAKNKELEVKEVAREILKLQNENIKTSDIAILYRDEVYENYEYIFKDYNLDIHLDKNIEVKNHRLIKFITEILTFDEIDFKNNIINILKTQLTNFENIYKEKLIAKLLFNDISLDKKTLEKKFSMLEEAEIREKLREISLIKELNDYTRLDDILLLVKSLSINEVENIFNEKLVQTLDDINSEEFIKEYSNITEESLVICKQIIIELVEKIEQISKNNKVKAIVKKIENLFEYCNIRMYLDKEDGEYDDIEELKIDSIDRQVYKKTLELLKSILDSFGNEEIEFNTFTKLIIIGLNTIKYRSIPEVNESIIMAKMDLAKVENKKIVFVLGFNKDVLPKVNKSGLLDDNDKEYFAQEGIFLSPSTSASLIDEEFVAYIALSRAREKTYISYSLLDKNYKENFASPYLAIVKNLIPDLKERTTSKILEFNIADYEYYSENMNEILTTKEYNYLFSKIYRRFLEVRNSNTKEERILENLLEKYLARYTIYPEQQDQNNYVPLGKLNDRIYFDKEISVKNYLDKIIKDHSFTLSEELISRFLEEKGEKFSKFSNSKIEEYEKNPYLFFVTKILEIDEQRKREIDALVKGKFFHAVLADRRIVEFIKEIGEKVALDEDAINKINIREKIEEVVYDNENADIKEMLNLTKLLNTHNYIFQTNMMRLELAVLMEIKYYAITSYAPKFLEKRFSLEITKNSISCQSLVEKNKVITKKFKKNFNIPTIKFNGVIDRVDEQDKNIVIIDYKSSKSDFDLNNLELGKISQILTYALACELLFEKKSEDILGVFYREIAKSREKLSDYRLRGIVNEDLILNNDDFSPEEVMYLRITKSGKVHAGDAHRAYKSDDFQLIVEKNLYNIMLLIEEIYNFDYSFEKYEVEDTYLAEKQTLFKYVSNDNLKLELKQKVNLKKKDLQKKIIEDMKNL